MGFIPLLGLLLGLLFVVEMMPTMVAKNGGQGAVPLAGGTNFCPLHHFVTAAVAKFGTGDQFDRTVGTELHVELFVVRMDCATKVKLFVFLKQIFLEKN